MDVDVTGVLTALDIEIGEDLAEQLGPDWRQIVAPHIEAAWCFGYTAGMSDSARVDQLLDSQLR